MPEIMDLSDLKNKKPDANADFEKLSDEEKEALSKMAEDHPQPEAEVVRTAFLVVINAKGEVGVMPDITIPLIREHLPSTEEMYTAVSVIRKDIEVQETAQHTAAFMHQLATAAQAQLQSQALAARLNLPK